MGAVCAGTGNELNGFQKKANWNWSIVYIAGRHTKIHRYLEIINAISISGK